MTKHKIGILHPGQMGISVAASALKMCFAAYTKGTTALLCAILATAETLGVREELERQSAIPVLADSPPLNPPQGGGSWTVLPPLGGVRGGQPGHIGNY